MVLNKKRYLVSGRILCGEFFDLHAEDAFITMREPDALTAIELEKEFKTGDPKRIVDAFTAAMPGLIIDHNFEGEDRKALPASEVVAAIADKLDLFLHVLNEYKDKVLFILGKKSGEN